MSAELTGVRVIVSANCDDCENGIVSDPTGFYAGHWDLSEAEREARETQYESEHGGLPAEEAPCHECNGSGRRERTVTLDAFRDLLAATPPSREGGNE